MPSATHDAAARHSEGELTAAGAACLRLYQRGNYSGPLPSNETLKLVEGYAPKFNVGGDTPSLVAAPGALTLACVVRGGGRRGVVVVVRRKHARCLVTGSHRGCGTFFEAISKHAAALVNGSRGPGVARLAGLEIARGALPGQPGRGLVPASKFFTLRRPRRWRAVGSTPSRPHRPRRPRGFHEAANIAQLI